MWSLLPMTTSRIRERGMEAYSTYTLTVQPPYVQPYRLAYVYTHTHTQVRSMLAVCCGVQTSSECYGTAPALGGVRLSHSHFLDGNIMAPHAWETNPFRLCTLTPATFIRLQLNKPTAQSELPGKQVSSFNSHGNMIPTTALCNTASGRPGARQGWWVLSLSLCGVCRGLSDTSKML